MRLEQVVRIPRVQRLSLMATGIPARGPRGSPAALAASMRSASARARSAVTSRKAFTWGSTASMRARCWSVSSRADTSPRSNRSRHSAIPIQRDISCGGRYQSAS
jgi:hypothetical protein